MNTVERWLEFHVADGVGTILRFPATSDWSPDFSRMGVEARMNYRSCVDGDVRVEKRVRLEVSRIWHSTSDAVATAA